MSKIKTTKKFNSNLTGNFFQCPNTVFDFGLCPNEGWVLMYFMRLGERSFPSLETIAKNCGMGKSAVKQVIKRLDAKGLISWVSGNTGKSNFYTINISVLKDSAPKIDESISRKEIREIAAKCSSEVHRLVEEYEDLQWDLGGYYGELAKSDAEYNARFKRELNGIETLIRRWENFIDPIHILKRYETNPEKIARIWLGFGPKARFMFYFELKDKCDRLTQKCTALKIERYFSGCSLTIDEFFKDNKLYSPQVFKKWHEEVYIPRCGEEEARAWEEEFGSEHTPASNQTDNEPNVNCIHSCAASDVSIN